MQERRVNIRSQLAQTNFSNDFNESQEYSNAKFQYERRRMECLIERIESATEVMSEMTKELDKVYRKERGQKVRADRLSILRDRSARDQLRRNVYRKPRPTSRRRHSKER